MVVGILKHTRGILSKKREQKSKKQQKEDSELLDLILALDLT